MPVTRDFTPRLMPAPQAAHYLGVSESTLRTIDLPRKTVGAKKMYDKFDLDQWVDTLPYENEQLENVW